MMPAFMNVEAMRLLPAAARLARRLVMIAEGYGEVSAARRKFRLSQDRLALMLAMSRQTTNQLLKETEARGILRLQYGEIEILDVQKLQAAGGE